MSKTCFSRQDPKWVIRSRKSKQYRTNNDLQNITQKTKNGATQTSQNVGGIPMCFRRVNMSCSNGGIRRVTITGQKHVTSNIVVITIH